MTYLVWYGLSSVVLAVILFFPVRKLMLAININRHQRKIQRPISEAELETLDRKVKLIAGLISVTFGFFYTKVLMVRFFSG